VLSRTLHSILKLFLLCGLLALALPARAHIGTPNVFVQANAGPYPLYVTLTPPAVIPGQATVSVICACSNIRSISAQANVLEGESARNMPEGMALSPGPPGSHEFDGTVWIMTQGSWQVRLQVAGDAGPGTLAIPLPASPTRLMRMSRPFGALLIVLGLVLIAGFASLAAAVSEAQIEPGTEPTAADRRHGYRAALIALAGCVILLALGNHLWRQEISRYSGNIYQPLTMTPSLTPGNRLHLQLRPPGVVQEILATRRLDDLVLDHNHLMHLYIIRWPAMDVAFHLHPDQLSAGDFELTLPTVPPGDYRLFADIVHATGFPETATATLHLDVPHGLPLTGDDAEGPLPTFQISADAPPAMFMTLPDGYRYRLAISTPGTDTATTSAIRANTPVVLRFTLLDPAGKAPTDMANYMGMLGHAAIVKSDGSVFAHIHPDGSVSMPAYMMANAAASPQSANPSMPGMDMPSDVALSNTAAFPFGFPSAGRYRIIVQMKHGATIETGAVDLLVQ
jgi:hypothetical protein